MKLYVVRHGETKENQSEIMQGNMDTVLNDIGISQAQTVRQKLQDVKFDLVVASPMKRTVKTAEIIVDNKVPIIKDKRLLSRDHGEFEGLTRNDIDLQGYWNIKENRQYEKAESVGHIYDRVASLIDELQSKYENKTILLVTHSGICRILYYYFNGIPEDGNLLSYKSTNCSVEIYEMEE